MLTTTPPTLDDNVWVNHVKVVTSVAKVASVGSSKTVDVYTIQYIEYQLWGERSFHQYIRQQMNTLGFTSFFVFMMSTTNVAIKSYPLKNLNHVFFFNADLKWNFPCSRDSILLDSGWMYAWMCFQNNVRSSFRDITKKNHIGFVQESALNVLLVIAEKQRVFAPSKKCSKIRLFDN